MTLGVTITPMAKVISKLTEVTSGQSQKRYVLIKVNGEKAIKWAHFVKPAIQKQQIMAKPGKPQAAHEAVLNKVIAQVNSTWLRHWLIMYNKNTQWVLYIYFTIT